MNIIQVSPRYPPVTGGIERHVRAISKRLTDRGHDVTVITVGYGWRTKRETIDGVTIIRVPGIAPNNSYHIAPSVATEVRQADVDVVHAHGYHSLPLLFAGIGRSRDTGFVATPHYLGHATGVRGLLHTIYRPFGRIPLQHANKILAVSEWERNKLNEELKIDASVIPNGIDVEKFAGAEPYPSSSPYVLSAGRLVKSKGVEHVIRSLAEIPDLHLKITGTGPDEERLRKVARKSGVEMRVKFLGYVSEEQLAELYAGADVHVTLSEFECYGLTVGESLAAGTPVVVYNRTALSDWTHMKGCLGVDDRTPETVATTISSIRGCTTNPDQLIRWEEITQRLVDEVYMLFK